ncbi:MAG: phage baseplate assembly protein V [Nannocystaceae bacterium]
MSVVTATLRDKAGKAMPTTYELMAIDVEREVDRIPRCGLRLLDGDLARGTFPVSDAEFFRPGATIEVALRHEGESSDAVVFAGLVVRQGLEISPRGAVLSVELRDRAIALTRPRRSEVYAKKSDSAVIRELARAAALEVRAAVNTEPTHPELVQYDASDWDFILARAEAQGLWVALTDGALTLARAGAPRRGARRHTLVYGRDEIYDVDLEADGLGQVAGVEAVTWDPAHLKVGAPARGAGATRPPGDLDGAKIAGALGFADTVLRHVASVDPGELKAWADAQTQRSRLSLVRGRVGIRGVGEVALLDALELRGIGDRFSGATTITGLRHRVSTAGWRTDLQFGIAPRSRAEDAATRASSPPAAGLLPALTGLQIGVVAPFEDDAPDHLRVRVLVPAINARDGVVWARVARPDAGDGRGFCFRPEPGDEVVVGFVAGDPRQALILGALHSAKNKPPTAVASTGADNDKKGIVTRRGVKIEIDDGDPPRVKIATPGGLSIVLDDAEEAVALADSNENSITLGAEGITIKSAKAITLDCSGGAVKLLGKSVEAK